LFRIHLLVSEQRLNVDAARLSFDEHGQKLTNDVRRAYYDVLQSQSQHESQESVVKYLNELQQLTERRLGQQAALEADKLSVKAEVAKAVYQLTTIEDTLADRKEALNHLLGRNLETDFSVESAPESFPEDQDLTTARATALEHRPEMKQAANRMSQAKLETKIEKTHYIPDISIQANYLTTANIDFLPQNIGSLGALLTWQLWDWGKKRHNVGQDVLAEKQAALSVGEIGEHRARCAVDGRALERRHAVGADLGASRGDGLGRRVRLRRQRQVDRRLGEIQRALGQADPVDGAGRCVGDQQRLRVGLADVLGGEDDHAAGDEARVLAALEHRRQVVERGVDVGAAGRLDPGRDEVVVAIALAVVVDRLALQRVLDRGDVDRPPARALDRALERREGDPGIAAAALGA